MSQNPFPLLFHGTSQPLDISLCFPSFHPSEFLHTLSLPLSPPTFSHVSSGPHLKPELFVSSPFFLLAVTMIGDGIPFPDLNPSASPVLPLFPTCASMFSIFFFLAPQPSLPTPGAGLLSPSPYLPSKYDRLPGFRSLKLGCFFRVFDTPC